MSNYVFHPAAWLMLVAALAALAPAILVWRYRSVPGALPFLGASAVAGLWSVASALELAGTNLSVQLFWADVQYLSFAILPSAWLLMILQYSGNDSWLAPRRVALLAIVPAITMILAWTDSYHGLVRSAVYLDMSGAFPVIAKQYGPWFWVHATYSYLLVLTGAIILITSPRHSVGIRTRQNTALVVGTLLPAISSALYVLRLTPWPRIDVTPIVLGCSGLVIGWALVRLGLFEIVPVARDRVLEVMADGVVVLDVEDRVLDLNPTALRIVGLSLSRALGRPILEVMPSWRQLAEAARRSEADGRLVLVLPDTTPERTDGAGLETPNGTVAEPAVTTLGASTPNRYYEISFSMLAGHGSKLLGRVIILHDITQHQHAEDELRQREQRFREFVELLPQPACECDPRLRLTFVNRAALELFGYTEEDLAEGLTVPRMLAQDDLGRARVNLGRTLTGERLAAQEYDCRRKDGSTFPTIIYSTPINEHGRVVGLRALIIDITARKRTEARISHLATHDSLTGLPNRCVLADSIDQILAYQVELDTTSPDFPTYPRAALLSLDVDAFKLVNDLLGHATGDRVLIELIRALHEKMRIADLFVRVGDDEFAVLVEGRDFAETLAVAERLRRVAREVSYNVGGRELYLGLSIGIAVIHRQSCWEEVLAQADAAMYRAKEEGRDRVVVFESGMESSGNGLEL